MNGVMLPRLVLFDCDGVLLESIACKTEAFRALFAQYPQHIEAIVRIHLDNGGLSRFKKFEMIYRDLLHEPLSEAQSMALGERFSELVFASLLSCELVRGTQEMLTWLSQRRRLYVVTGAPAAEQRRVLEARGLMRYFVDVYGTPMSKTEGIRAVLAREGVAPPDAVMIGDAMQDYTAAHEAGVPFVGRVWGERHPFHARHDVACVRDLEELLSQWRALSEERETMRV